jgi:hypothetical protein
MSEGAASTASSLHKSGEADLASIARSAGNIHNDAIEFGIKFRSLPEGERVRAGISAISELRSHDKLSITEAKILAEMLEFASRIGELNDEVVKIIRSTEEEISGGTHPSPIAVMLSSIAVNSAELQKHHHPDGQHKERGGFGGWLVDVGAGAAGAALGGAASGFTLSLTIGITFATAASAYYLTH